MDTTFFETTDKEFKFFSDYFLYKKEFNIHYTEEPLTEKNIAQYTNSHIICIFVHSQINENLLKKFKNLKYIVTRSTGYNHIDQKYCIENNIKILNVPEYGSITVAEYAIGLLLTLLRQISISAYDTKQGNYTKNRVGQDLQGKTIGVIGTGKIGSNFIKRISAFETKIIAFDIKHQPQLIEEYKVEYVDLDSLLRQSDIISLHLPLLPSTHHIINSESFKKMKDDVVIINTSRGELIDSTALLNNIKSGKVYGAGLDVFEDESILIKNISQDQNDKHIAKQLNQFENVIITPHNAFNSQEALSRIMKTTAENIESTLTNNVLNSIFN